jgi:hypothetical protein
VPAIGCPTEHHPIADRKLRDTWPDTFDDARAFMTRDTRHRVFGIAGGDMPIAMANTTRFDPNENFPGTRIGKLKRFNPKGLIGFVKNRGTNGA